MQLLQPIQRNYFHPMQRNYLDSTELSQTPIYKKTRNEWQKLLYIEKPEMSDNPRNESQKYYTILITIFGSTFKRSDCRPKGLKVEKKGFN